MGLKANAQTVLSAGNVLCLARRLIRSEAAAAAAAAGAACPLQSARIVGSTSKSPSLHHIHLLNKPKPFPGTGRRRRRGTKCKRTQKKLSVCPLLDWPADKIFLEAKKSILFPHIPLFRGTRLCPTLRILLAYFSLSHSFAGNISSLSPPYPFPVPLSSLDKALHPSSLASCGPVFSIPPSSLIFGFLRLEPWLLARIWMGMPGRAGPGWAGSGRAQQQPGTIE